jgi:intracellular multiplication protein IcmB
MLTSLMQSLSAFSQAFKLDLASRCFVELWDGSDLIGRDGSLAKIVRVDGMKELRSFLDIETFLTRASEVLNSPLGQRGRAVQIWYERNPDLSKIAAAEQTRVPRLTSERLGLDMARFLDDREAKLASRIVPDVLYFVLWTRPGVLTPREISNLKKDKPPSWWPGAVLGQDIFRAVPAMRIKHRAWTGDIISSLRGLGLVVRDLTGHQSVGAIRHNFRPNFDQSHLKPWLPGDALATDKGVGVRDPDENAGVPEGDLSHLLWPRLPPIIVDDTDAEALTGRIIRLGENFYAPLEMSVAPQDQQPFQRLFDRLIGEDVPWRMSVLLEGQGSRAFQVKKFLSAISGWSSAETSLIRQGLLAAEAMETNGQSVLRTRISFATWARKFQEAEIRQAKLQQAVETWGSCVTSAGGDPMTLAFSTMVGIDPASAATSGLSSVKGALRFLPWARNASPFSSGAVTFVTEGNTAWNWSPGNRSQDSAVELLVGPPGKGKSVTMNTIAMAFILSQASNPKGLARLPRYSLLDIGHSSVGFIETLRALLPPHRRDEAQHHRLTMESRHSINPFDLQPGLRYPLRVERGFLTNFLCLLVTPVGEEKVPAGLSELAGQVIDEAYKACDDDPAKAGSPKLWSKGEDPDIDRVLQDVGINPLQGSTTWFDITDELHHRGMTDESILAQRHAVPKLADLMSIVRSPSIEDTWGDAKLQSGEKLTTVFWRAVSSALREYPIFQSATKFSIGRARVVSLDLQNVTGSGGDAADRRTAIMYMLGRFALTRDYYCSRDTIDQAPVLWRDWHATRAREVAEAPARFAMDEFHRTSKAPGVRDQVILDMREGRKFNIQIMLASQIITDFDSSMIELATSIYILGTNSDAAAKQISEIFNLSPAAYASIESFLRGPGPRGAPMLALHNMKDGRHEHKLYNVLGPSEAWAYSTSPDDVNLRTRAMEKVSFPEACSKLGKMFPGGSAGQMIESLRESQPTANPFDVILSRLFMKDGSV